MLHPGEKEPTSFTISLNGEYKQVGFDAALESLNQGEVNLSIYNNGKLISKKYLTPGHKEQLKIDTTGINNLKVTIDSGKNGPGYDTTILNNIYLEPLTKK